MNLKKFLIIFYTIFFASIPLFGAAEQIRVDVLAGTDIFNFSKKLKIFYENVDLKTPTAQRIIALILQDEDFKKNALPILYEAIMNKRSANVTAICRAFPEVINQDGGGRAYPLHCAVGTRCEPIIRILLETKADILKSYPTARDSNALMIAARTKAPISTVKLLLDANANPNEINGQGQTALQIAQEEKADKKVITLLDSVTAKNIPVPPNIVQANLAISSLPQYLQKSVYWMPEIDLFLENAEMATEVQQKNITESVSKKNYNGRFLTFLVFAIVRKNYRALELACKYFALEEPDGIIEALHFALENESPDTVAIKILVPFLKYDSKNLQKLQNLLLLCINHTDQEIIEPILSLLIELLSKLDDTFINKPIPQKTVQGFTLLIGAAGRCSPTIIKKFIDCGANARIANEEGLTPLTSACYNTKTENAKLLIPLSDVNTEWKTNESKTTAFSLVCSYGLIELVPLLITANANINYIDSNNNSPLMEVVIQKHLNIVQHLAPLADLTYARPDKVTLLATAAVVNDGEILREILKFPIIKKEINKKTLIGRTAFLCAIAQNQLITAKILLEEGADATIPEDDNANALHYAVHKRNLEAVKLLLPFDLFNGIANGATPLIVLCEKIKKDQSNFGTILQIAKLIAPRSPLNVQNKDGMTALMLAAQKGHALLVEYFLSLNPDTTLKNSQGLTAEIIARKARFAHIATAIAKKQRAQIKQKKESIKTEGNFISDIQHRMDALGDKILRGETPNEIELALLKLHSKHVSHKRMKRIREILGYVDPLPVDQPIELDAHEAAHAQARESSTVSLDVDFRATPATATSEKKDDEKPCTSAPGAVRHRPTKQAQPYLPEEYLPRVSSDYRRADNRLNQQVLEYTKLLREMKRNFPDTFALLREMVKTKSHTPSAPAAAAAVAAALPKGTMQVRGDHLSLKFDLNHIFRGSQNEAGHYSGLHHDYNRRLEKKDYFRTTSAHPNGCYTARIGQEEKSFFPADWHPEEVIDHIIEGYDLGELQYEQDPKTGNHIVHFTIENPGVDLRVNQILVRLIFNKRGTRIISVYPVLS